MFEFLNLTFLSVFLSLARETGISQARCVLLKYWTGLWILLSLPSNAGITGVDHHA